MEKQRDNGPKEAAKSNIVHFAQSKHSQFVNTTDTTTQQTDGDSRG